MSISPAYQAALDWRYEGTFHPEQYLYGSAEFIEYCEAADAIEHEEKMNYEIRESNPS